MSTFSARPSRSSTLPARAASDSTRVVDWDAAAARKLSASSATWVMPRRLDTQDPQDLVGHQRTVHQALALADPVAGTHAHVFARHHPVQMLRAGRVARLIDRTDVDDAPAAIPLAHPDHAGHLGQA